MTNSPAPQIVGVISSCADLGRALRMRTLPDFFELRLDALAKRTEETIEVVAKLRSPLIITARHSHEGGLNHLSARARETLLRRFMPHAACLDIELRSIRTLAAVMDEAQAKNVRMIISFHDFKDTPSRARLDEIARAAHSLGADSAKVATRTDTQRQLTRLLDFFERHRPDMKIAAMGIGRLGRISRLELARRGSVLNYAHLGTPRAAGQLSIAELRRALKDRPGRR
jgi:3-dehydroquinate dehydratase-1